MGKAQVAGEATAARPPWKHAKGPRATLEVIDTSKQKLYTSGLSSEQVRGRYSRILSQGNLKKGELEMGQDGDIIKGGEPAKKKKAKKKAAAPKKAAKKPAAKK